MKNILIKTVLIFFVFILGIRFGVFLQDIYKTTNYQVKTQVIIKEKIVNKPYLVLKTIKPKEIIILSKIVEAEATGATIKQKENVAQCILNRVASQKFPNNIKDVVYQKNQFSPLYDGRYYNVKITESTIKAVENVLEYPNKHKGLFFMVRNMSDPDNVTWFDENLEFLFNDGLHEYFK